MVFCCVSSFLNLHKNWLSSPCLSAASTDVVFPVIVIKSCDPSALIKLQFEELFLSSAASTTSCNRHRSVMFSLQPLSVPPKKSAPLPLSASLSSAPPLRLAPGEWFGPGVGSGFGGRGAHDRPSIDRPLTQSVEGAATATAGVNAPAKAASREFKFDTSPFGRPAVGRTSVRLRLRRRFYLVTVVRRLRCSPNEIPDTLSAILAQFLLARGLLEIFLETMRKTYPDTLNAILALFLLIRGLLEICLETVRKTQNFTTTLLFFELFSTFTISTLCKRTNCRVRQKNNQ